EVHLYIAEFIASNGDAPLLPDPSEKRLQSGEQFVGVERLVQVVIRAEFQPDDAIYHLGFGCQHENRRVDALLAELAADIEPGLLREQDVQDYGVIGRVYSLVETGLAIERRIDFMSFAAEQVRDCQHETRLVFN